MGELFGGLNNAAMFSNKKYNHYKLLGNGNKKAKSTTPENIFFN